jgi:hypothetical protein
MDDCGFFGVRAADLLSFGHGGPPSRVLQHAPATLAAAARDTSAYRLAGWDVYAEANGSRGRYKAQSRGRQTKQQRADHARAAASKGPAR